MGTVQILECDAYKTRRNVQEYTLTLTRKFMASTEKVWAHDVALSPRGEARLSRFIRKGLKPPSAGQRDRPTEGVADANAG